MKRFCGFYSNGTYQVGCQEHIMYLYDAEGRELARFRDLHYAPRGGFLPGTSIFVLRSTEGRLAVYDCNARKILKKFNFSIVRYAQDDGFCFSPDGKYFYNIERFPRDTQSRLTVYETEGFTPVKVLWEGEERKVPCEVFYDESRDQIQLLYFVRGGDGSWAQWYAGTLAGDRIAMLRPLSMEEFEFLRCWLSLRASGFTEKAMEWSGLHYEGYTNDQLRLLRDREPDLYTFDLEEMNRFLTK